MANDYDLNILIHGENDAGEAFDSLKEGFGGIMEVAGGGLLKDALEGIAEGIADVAREAFASVGALQQTDIQFQYLFAHQISSDYNRAHTRQEVTSAIVGLSDQEQAKLGQLQDKYTKITDTIDVHVLSYNKLKDKYGELDPRVRQAADNLEMERSSALALSDQMNTLSAKTSQTVSVMTDISTGSLSVADALKQANGPAHDMIEWIHNLSLNTPFTTEQIASAAAMSMKMGMNSETVKDLTVAIGNFDAGTNAHGAALGSISSAFARMQAMGTVNTRIIRGLITAGFPMQVLYADLAKTHDTTTAAMQKMIAKGLIPVTEFTQEFIKLSGEQWPDAMSKQAATMDGLSKRIGNFFETVLGEDVFKPVVDIFTEQLSGVLTTIMAPQVQEQFVRFGEALKGVVTYLLPLFDNLWGSIQQFFSVLYHALGIDLTKFDFYATLVKVTIGIGDFINRVSDFVDTLSAQLPDAVVQAQTAMAPFIAAFWNLLTAAQGSLPAIKGLVADATAFIQTQFAMLFPQISGDTVGTLNTIANFWRQHSGEVMLVIALLTRIIITTFSVAFAILGAVIHIAVVLFTSYWTAFSDLFKGNWRLALTDVLGSAQSMFAILTDLARTVMNLILSIVGTNLGEFVTVWGGTFTLIWQSSEKSLQLVSFMIYYYLNMFSQYWIKFFNDIGVTIAEGLLIVILLFGKAWTDLQKAFDDAIAALIKGFENYVQSWQNIGINIINGIITGINSAIGGLIDAAKNAVAQTVAAVKGALDGHSPSLVFHAIGRDTMTGFALGMTQNVGLPERAAHLAGEQAARSISNYYQQTIYTSQPVNTQSEFAMLKTAYGAGG